MLLRAAATVVATCFCLGPSPVPEQAPVASDVVISSIHDEVRSDALPLRCLSSARAWSHLADGCPRMPADAFTHAGAKPLLLGRIR